jgi:hypothetical protein
MLCYAACVFDGSSSVLDTDKSSQQDDRSVHVGSALAM